uniref:CAF1B/HIR1 beta-propeller domain-containing protein n=2 Tax=Timema TaxID=61471 RepID=A0A7R9B710_TIMSH|nr:unnamed protein product [Timema shepardi]
MKCTIPEISWHNRDPVLSIDIQSGKEDNFYRLASGGTDTHVVIWHVRVQDSGMAEVECAADLQRHQKAVNAVRFSPSGHYLASGDDESVIIVWKQKTDQDAPEFPTNDVDTNKEQWLTMKTLRGHLEDVYDLCWSPDSTCLISGSVDNTAILWDVQKGRNMGILSEHKSFVQGVTWDPKNQYVATMCSDRTCRVFNIQSRKVASRASKSFLPVPEGHELDGKQVRLFHDDTLKSFFRRLTFSPDGELLIAPSGIVESPDTNKHCNATHIFTRRLLNSGRYLECHGASPFSTGHGQSANHHAEPYNCLTTIRTKRGRPVMFLPSPDQYTIAVRCCPLLFELHDGESMFALPYRMILAVASQSSVVLYDTQQPEPFGIISNIHYTRLTDLAWSSDGRALVVSSTDGYCSIVTFTEGELGKEYKPSKDTQESDGQTPSKSNKAEKSVNKIVNDTSTLQTSNMEINESHKAIQLASVDTNNERHETPTEIADASDTSKRKGGQTVENENYKFMDHCAPVKEETKQTIAKTVEEYGVMCSINVEDSKKSLEVAMKPVKKVKLITVPKESSSLISSGPSETNVSLAKNESPLSTSKTIKRIKPILLSKKSPLKLNCAKEVKVDNKSLSPAKDQTDSKITEEIDTKSSVSDENKKVVTNYCCETSETVEKMEVDDKKVCIISPQKAPQTKTSTLKSVIAENKSLSKSSCDPKSTTKGIEQTEPLRKDKELLETAVVSKTSDVISSPIKISEIAQTLKSDCSDNEKTTSSDDNSNNTVTDDKCGMSELEPPRTPSKLNPDSTEPCDKKSTPSSPAQGQISSPCVTPNQEGKKFPRRVQLITLSSPKSKKKLL